jgi:hypothetical protein
MISLAVPPESGWLAGLQADQHLKAVLLYLLRTKQIPEIRVLVFKVDRQKKCRYAEGVKWERKRCRWKQQNLLGLGAMLSGRGWEMAG